jgi:hypothetical protein
MKIFAYSPEVIENKSAKWILEPFIKAGARRFDRVSDIPDNHILISVHHPPWRSPYKEWIAKGNDHIEIDYGYWGHNQPRRNTRRVTFNGSHNIKMSKPPYSRLNTLDPAVSNWQHNRGDHLLLIEPQQQIIHERTSMDLGTWKLKMLDTLKEYWDGPIKWRRKAGGKNPGRWPSFLEDLKVSHAVLGERTMACVEAVMLGWPAYTTDFSTVSLLMGNDLSKIKNPVFPDRTQWLEHVAWSQFTPEEFSNGTKIVDMLIEYQMEKK